MSKLTEEQENHLIDLIERGDYCEFDDSVGNDEFDAYIESLGYTNDFECIDYWGGEGQGEDIGAVQHSKSMDLYLRIDGYYMSHHGAEYDESPYVVRPVERMVTFYE